MDRSELENLKNLAILGLGIEKELKGKKRKRTWQRKWVARRGNLVPLFQEIEDEDPLKFLANFRMTIDVFDEISEKIGPLIQKQVCISIIYKVMV